MTRSALIQRYTGSLGCALRHNFAVALLVVALLVVALLVVALLVVALIKVALLISCSSL